MDHIQAISDPEAYRLFLQRVESRQRRGLPPIGVREEEVELEVSPAAAGTLLEPPAKPKPRQKPQRMVTPKRRPKPKPDAPERSLVQRREALVRANEIRMRRAQLKRDLKAGRASIHDVLLEPPEWCETAKAFDLILAVPKYGRVKVNRVLQQCRISPSKTVGGMSTRQRTELVSMLRR